MASNWSAQVEKLTIHHDLHDFLLLDDQPCLVVKLYVEAQAVLSLVILVQLADEQRHVGLSEDEVVAVHHVNDVGFFGKCHQCCSGTARPCMGPCPLDLHLVQWEVGLNIHEQWLPFNTLAD